MVDDRKMKISRVLLSCMIVSFMMPAFADDTDGQHRWQGKRDSNSKQQTTTTITTTSPPIISSRAAGSLMGFKHLPVYVPPTTVQGNVQINSQSNVQGRSQPQIQNAPVGNHQNNSSQQLQQQLSNTKFETQNSWDRDNHDQYHHHNWNNGYNNRNQTVNDGLGSDGYIRTTDSNLTSRGYIRADNSNLSSDAYIQMNQPRHINYGNSHGGYIHDQDDQGWQDQGWRNHDRGMSQYRMPYRQGYTDRYRVHYIQSWPSDYGWRSHGWSMNYRDDDPYWFAVITSIALAQAWSDAEVDQAINDQNLRQQLIDDEDIRQQMIASGYPVDQIDYLYADSGNRSYGYPLVRYDNPYDMRTTYPPQNPNTDYSSPTSNNPNSPLYNGVPLASGEQVANRNANQNALFFCNAGNKQQTADAIRQIQSPDMSVWKTTDAYNKCRSWATSL